LIFAHILVVHHNFTPSKTTTLFSDKYNLIKMRCTRCHSPRIIKFLDGFGDWRVFCRTCQESILEVDYYNLTEIKKLSEFSKYHAINHDMVR